MSTSTGWTRSHSPPILVDRCLPDGALAKGLRRYHITAWSMEEKYPGRGQEVQDVEWLEDAGRHGWTVLTQNPQIWYTNDERAVLEEFGARVFCLGSAQLPSEFKSVAFGRWWLPIMRRANKPGPCFWRVYFDKPPRKDLQ